jgi:hypothetical protein
MSNQPENEMRQILTPEEVRQSLFAEIEASKQTILDLSNEQLEEVAGALSLTGALVGLKRGWGDAANMRGNVGARIKAGFSSIPYGAKNGPGRDTVYHANAQARKYTTYGV